MSDRLEIILLDNLDNILEEINIKKPKDYQDLVLEIKKIKKSSNNFKIFIKSNEDSKIIIDNNRQYLFVKNIIFIKENEKDILDQSFFSINYNELSENYKDILDEKYNCLLCTEKIQKENPYFCYSCQKVYHLKCLQNWDKERRSNNKNFNCPFCREELPLEKWQKKINFQEIRRVDSEIMNKLNKYDNKIDEGKLKGYEEYIKKSCIFIKNILNKINEINLFIRNKNNIINKLLCKISFNYVVSSIDDISNIIINELGKIKKSFNLDDIINKIDDDISEIQKRYLYINEVQDNILEFNPYWIEEKYQKILHIYLRKFEIYTDAYMRKIMNEKCDDKIQEKLNRIIDPAKRIKLSLNYILSLKNNCIKRLIEGKSNISIEKKIISGILENEEKEKYSSMLKDLYNILDNIENCQKEIEEYKLSKDKNISNINFNVLICSNYDLNLFDKQISFKKLNFPPIAKLPKYLKSCLEDFEHYYKNKFINRKLLWHLYYSKVKIQFLMLKNKNVSNSTLIQYLILILLEKREKGLSIKNISKSLDLPVPQIINNIKGLFYNPSYNPKKEIKKGIILGNFEKYIFFEKFEFKETDVIRLNKNFDVDIKDFSTESFENSEYDQERYRKSILECSIASIMKKRNGQLTTIAWLSSEVNKEIDLFIPLEKEIKETIETLIGKSVIKRVRKNNEIFLVYIP